jgi:hypothetical protein
MTRLLDGHLARGDLVHGNQRLVPSAAFDLPHAHVAMTLHDVDGVAYLLDTVLTAAVGAATVSLHLTPRDYRPPLSPPEFPPSNLYFGVDPRHGVAAVALLAFDKTRHSHQWLSQGTAWHADVAPLAMDPVNADATPFPGDTYITAAQLRVTVINWAWGDLLPPAGTSWRAATEDEVGWNWF